MSVPPRIYLTGFMGCGKSSVGPLVANALGYAFVDLDEDIVREVGMPIDAIFSAEGEAAFRTIETAKLRETFGRNRVTIALGGGTLSTGTNLNDTLEQGVVVFLHVPAAELFRRLSGGQVERPLLRDATGRRHSAEVFLQNIETLLAKRMAIYRRAHLCVESGNKSMQETTKAIVHAITGWDKVTAG